MYIHSNNCIGCFYVGGLKCKIAVEGSFFSWLKIHFYRQASRTWGASSNGTRTTVKGYGISALKQ